MSISPPPLPELFLDNGRLHSLSNNSRNIEYHRNSKTESSPEEFLTLTHPHDIFHVSHCGALSMDTPSLSNHRPIDENCNPPLGGGLTNFDLCENQFQSLPNQNQNSESPPNQNSTISPPIKNLIFKNLQRHHRPSSGEISELNIQNNNTISWRLSNSGGDVEKNHGKSNRNYSVRNPRLYTENSLNSELSIQEYTAALRQQRSRLLREIELENRDRQKNSDFSINQENRNIFEDPESLPRSGSYSTSILKKKSQINRIEKTIQKLNRQESLNFYSSGHTIGSSSCTVNPSRKKYHPRDLENFQQKLSSGFHRDEIMDLVNANQVPEPVYNSQNHELPRQLSNNLNTHESLNGLSDMPGNPTLDAVVRNAWPFENGLWHSSPASVRTTNDAMSAEASSNLMASSSVTSRRAQSQQQLLSNKVHLVYDLLSMFNNGDLNETSRTLLAMSSSPDSCLTMRQSGCLPLLIQLIHGSDDALPTREIRLRASQALHNIVYTNTDDKKARREARVLKLLEQLRSYSDLLWEKLERVTAGRGPLLDDEMNQHPTAPMAALMKFSFDEEHRHAMCTLGGLHAIAELIRYEHQAHGHLTADQHCTSLRRYAGMALTNLTFGDGTNKSLLCSFTSFMKALISQLHSPSQDLRQVTASVLRNLSWRADSGSKKNLREIGAVTSLMEGALTAKKESTLKVILSAIWNLSAHCSVNKSDICAVDGALEFICSALTYKSEAKTLSIVENSGGILRNISSYIADHDHLRQILRQQNTLSVLLSQLRSPSLTIVSNACGTLWNLSARCPQDQAFLWNLGAVPMLRSLINSKHKMISMGASAALKNLLHAKPEGASVVGDRFGLGLGLQARKQKALEQEIDSSLAETCDNIERSPNSSPTPNDQLHMFHSLGPHFENFSRNGLSASHESVKSDITHDRRQINSLKIKEKHQNGFNKAEKSGTEGNNSVIPMINNFVDQNNDLDKYDQNNDLDQVCEEQPTDFSSKYTELDTPNVSNGNRNGIKFERNTLPGQNFKRNTLSHQEFERNTLPHQEFKLNTLPEQDFERNTLPEQDLEHNTLPDQEDSLQTFATENTPYNASISTSLTNLNHDENRTVRCSRNKESASNSSERTKEGSELPLQFHEEGSPINLSRASSVSSISVTEIDMQCIDNELDDDSLTADCENPSSKNRHFQTVLEKAQKRQFSLKNSIKYREIEVSTQGGNVVSFENGGADRDFIANGDAEGPQSGVDSKTCTEINTPLMFSRNTSPSSLASMDFKSICDDKSSVVSGLSRMTSGMISPSQIPESPSQTVLSSPARGVSPQLNSEANERRSDLHHANVFSDRKQAFLEEGTPAHFSNRTSLSPLSFDDFPPRSCGDGKESSSSAHYTASSVSSVDHSRAPGLPRPQFGNSQHTETYKSNQRQSRDPVRSFSSIPKPHTRSQESETRKEPARNFKKGSAAARTSSEGPPSNQLELASVEMDRNDEKQLEALIKSAMPTSSAAARTSSEGPPSNQLELASVEMDRNDEKQLEALIKSAMPTSRNTTKNLSTNYPSRASSLNRKTLEKSPVLPLPLPPPPTSGRSVGSAIPIQAANIQVSVEVIDLNLGEPLSNNELNEKRENSKITGQNYSAIKRSDLAKNPPNNSRIKTPTTPRQPVIEYKNYKPSGSNRTSTSPLAPRNSTTISPSKTATSSGPSNYKSSTSPSNAKNSTSPSSAYARTNRKSMSPPVSRIAVGVQNKRPPPGDYKMQRFSGDFEGTEKFRRSSGESSDCSNDGKALLEKCIRSGMPKFKNDSDRSRPIFSTRRPPVPIARVSPAVKIGIVNPRISVLTPPKPAFQNEELKSYALEGTPANFSPSNSLSDISVDSFKSKPKHLDSKDCYGLSKNSSLLHCEGEDSGPQSTFRSPIPNSRESECSREDVVRVYHVEGTPVLYSHNSSLSNLSTKSTQSGDSDLPKTSKVDSLKEEEKEEALIRNCINQGMPKSSSRIPQCFGSASASKIAKPHVPYFHERTPALHAINESPSNRNELISNANESPRNREQILINANQSPRIREELVNRNAVPSNREESFNNRTESIESTSHQDIPSSQESPRNRNEISCVRNDSSRNLNSTGGRGDIESQKLYTEVAESEKKLKTVQQKNVENRQKPQHRNVMGLKLNCEKALERKNLDSSSESQPNFVSISSHILAEGRRLAESMAGRKNDKSIPSSLQNSGEDLSMMSLSFNSNFSNVSTQFNDTEMGGAYEGVGGACEIGLNEVDPPSAMDSLISLSASTNDGCNLETKTVVTRLECRHNKVPQAIKRALGNENNLKYPRSPQRFPGSLTGSCHSNIDNIPPPFNDADMENSMMSVDSIASEVIEQGLCSRSQNVFHPRTEEFWLTNFEASRNEQNTLQDITITDLPSNISTNVRKVIDTVQKHRKYTHPSSTCTLTAENDFRDESTYQLISDLDETLGQQKPVHFSDFTDTDFKNNTDCVLDDVNDVPELPYDSPSRAVRMSTTPKTKRAQIKAERGVKIVRSSSPDESSCGSPENSPGLSYKTPKERRNERCDRFKTRTISYEGPTYQTEPDNCPEDSQNGHIIGKIVPLESLNFGDGRVRRSFKQRRSENPARYITRTIDSPCSDLKNGDLTNANDQNINFGNQHNGPGNVNSSRINLNSSTGNSESGLFRHKSRQLDCGNLKLSNEDLSLTRSEMEIISMDANRLVCSINKTTGGTYEASLEAIETLSISSEEDLCNLQGNMRNSEVSQGNNGYENNFLGSRARVVKPVENEINTEEKVETNSKGIRGRRKLLYPGAINKSTRTISTKSQLPETAPPKYSRNFFSQSKSTSPKQQRPNRASILRKSFSSKGTSEDSSRSSLEIYGASGSNCAPGGSTKHSSTAKNTKDRKLPHFSLFKRQNTFTKDEKGASKPIESSIPKPGQKKKIGRGLQ